MEGYVVATKTAKSPEIGSLRLSSDFDMPIEFYRTIHDKIEGIPPEEKASLLDISVSRFVEMCINNHNCGGVIYINHEYCGEIERVKESLLDRVRPK